MGNKKIYLTMMALATLSGSMAAQDFFDDVYYNPKKDKSVTVSPAKQTQSAAYTQASSYSQSQPASNYISNIGEMDVDAYNRRGQYYMSQIDTIGQRVENGEDFVYTQQIQKYYNPTIVVDNANVLGDVLSNAYGNVEIVINDRGIPVFAPYYGWNWPYYASAWSPWWGINVGGWGWSVGWYDPWYAWNWGWGPGWWNPGPSWGWGPAWGPAWRPGPMAAWAPRANRAVGPRPGWSVAAQHRGGNFAHNPAPVGGIYHGSSARPSGNSGGNYGGNRGGQVGSKPVGVVNNNGRWQYNTSQATGHRNAGTGVLPGQNRASSGINRTPVPATSTNKSGVSTNHRSTTTNRTTTTGNRTTTTSRPSVGSSTSTNRSVGSSGVSRSTGGATRSTGGGGSRGGGGGGRHR